MRKRILMLSGRWPPQFCGIGDYTFQLSRQLAKTNFEVNVLTRGESSLQPEGVALNKLSGSWKGLAPFKILQYARSPSSDILHVQWETYSFQQSWTLPMILRSLNIPIVLTLHEIFFRNSLHQIRDLSWMKNARHIIVNDQLSQQKLKAIRALEHIPHTVIGAGSNIPVAPGPSSPSKNEAIITFFGFLNAVKDIGALLAALSKVSGPNWKFRVVGALNPHALKDLQLKARELGIDGRVEVHNSVPATEVSKLLSTSTLCVLPFTDGASPRRGSLQACLAHGRAVITTSPKIAEPLFENEKNMLLIRDSSPDQIRASIEKLLNEEPLRTRIEQRALELAQHFSWTSIAQQHQRIYTNLTI